MKITGLAVIQQEVPGCYYRWFVSCMELHRDDPRRRHFFDRDCERCRSLESPKFWELEAAKIWCAEHGLRWRVSTRLWAMGSNPKE